MSERSLTMAREWLDEALGPCDIDGPVCHAHRLLRARCEAEAASLAGLLRQVAADAWDEGYTSGHSNAMRRMSDEPNVEPGVNPYRTGADQ